MNQQNLKYKVKEFEWFEMETKVRQIIQEVLGPMQKRILQNSTVLQKLKGNQITDQKKLEEITMMIADDPKVFETGVFARVERRFEEHARSITEMSRQIDEENIYIENKFKILDLRMQESSEVLKNVASLKERVVKQMEIQNDNIISVRSGLQKMISDLSKDIHQTRQYITDSIETGDKRNNEINEEIRQIRQNIMTIEDNLSLQRTMHSQKTELIEEHERTLERQGLEIKDLVENKYLTKKLNDAVDDMDNEIKKALFKVEAISPLVTQAQISQCLSAILPAKMKAKISIYEHKKYAHLNKEVLEKDFKTIKETFNGLALLATVQKKCTKDIVQLKRKKLLQMGVDIDHVTFEQREKYYNELSLDDELNLDYEEAKVTQKVDEKEVKRIMDNFMDEYMRSFKGNIQMEMEDSKKYLYQVEEEIRYEISKFEASMNSVKKQCSAFHTEHVLELKEEAKYSKSLEQKIYEVFDKVKESHDLQRLFYNFCSLINHLQIQDQIDKQNISFMGAKQSTAEEHTQTNARDSIIGLDGKCFSCNGFPATTISAFKMACLAYHPSAIKIDSKEYKREELLEFTTNMLQTIKKFIQGENVDLDTEARTLQSKRQNLTDKETGRPKNIENMGRRRQHQTQVSEETVDLKQNKTHSNNAFKTLEEIAEKRFGNVQVPSITALQTEDNHSELRRKTLSNHKFRKTCKKSLNTTFSSSYYKNKASTKKNSLNEDMINSSAIFNSVNKKHQSFLN